MDTTETPHARPFRSLLLSGALVPVRILHEALGGVRDWLGYQVHRERFRVRPDDIFVVTYPKSGTTLLQMMLYQLTTSGSMEIQHIENVSPWFEMELSRRDPAFLEDLPSPRVFKSHSLYYNLPKGARYIYVARNVQDVALSAFHHFCLMAGAEQNLPRFLDDFIAETAPTGSWFKHLRSWWPRRNDPNVLFLTYEEILADLEGAVRRVAGFCGIAIDEREMPRILERCSFSFMKRYNDKFDPRLSHVSFQGDGFIRQGRVGKGAEALTPEQRKRLEEKLEQLARDLGLSGDDPRASLLLPLERRVPVSES